MSDLPVGVLGLVIVLAVGVVVVGLTVAVRKRRRRVQAREEQDRQSYRRRLLSSLEALDLAMSNLTVAVHRGREYLARERVHRLAQAVSAANRSGDDELRRLVSVMATRSDALITAGRDGLEEEDFDRLVRQIGETQREIYRRMETLLDQVSD